MPTSRKRQQRLSFTPLPSSSPAAKGYNRQIQDRAAAVTVQGSPSKRRKLRNDGDDLAQMDGVNDSMPTPAATFERKGNRLNGTGISQEEEDSDDMPLVPTQRTSTQRKRQRPRQQRLDFSNNRDADSFDSPVKLSSSARPPSTAGTGMFASQRRRATIISSDDESEDELPSPAKLKPKNKGKSKGSQRAKKERREDKRTTRSMRRSSQKDPESDAEDKRASSPQQLPLEVESDNEEEDEMPSTMATQRRKRARKQATPDSFISSSPPPGPIDSDDDLEIIEKPSKRRGQGRARGSEEEDEDEDDDAAPVTPGRRKLQRPRKINQQEADDLAEDMDFLGPSSDVDNSARKPRNTQTSQKEARQSALDKLKRKRSNQSKQPEPILVDDDSDAEEQGSERDEDYDEDDGDDVYEAPQPPMSSRQFFTANDDDEGFIESEQEEDGILGHPDPNIPIQFTRFAAMKPKELFPFAMEWMVQKKINPAFSMDDEIYDLTFKKLNDEVRGLAGSKFTSAAWTEEFTYALNARPDIAYEPLDRSGEHYMNDHCDACNRSGHPATYQIQFQGQPYHRETLEEVNNDDDASDSDSDDDSSSSEENKDSKPSWDAEGREIVPVHKVFFVGKFCMGNAQTAHALQHWKYHLNEWVVTWLTKNGYLRPAEIVKRDGLSERKRRKHANKIADRMEKMGVTQQLWKDFRANIDQARNAKQGERW